MSTPNNQPVDHVRLGSIQAAVWKNTDQEGRSRFGVTIERIYKDADGNWKSTGSFARDELLLVAKVADRANTRIFELQAEERAAETQQTASTAGRSRRSR